MTTESSNAPTTTASSSSPSSAVTIGVLALQGSFREHCSALRRIPGVSVAEVKTAEDLAACDGLIIPGGESTTMALVAERWGLVAPLKDYASSGKPLWGTCAGLIFLANRAVGQKEGGQALLGGLDALVSRNFFGAQVDSFEATLPLPKCLEPFLSSAGSAAALSYSPSSSSKEQQQQQQEQPGFRAVFIRAPAVLETGPGVEVLAELELTEEQVAAAAARSSSSSLSSSSSSSPSSSVPPRRVAVAVRQGNLLATSFHPELTDDSRWHALFAAAVLEAKEGRRSGGGGGGGGAGTTAAAAAAAAEAKAAAAEATLKLGRKVNLPADLPVLAPGQKY